MDDKYGPHGFLFSKGQMFGLDTLIDSSLHERQPWPGVALNVSQALPFAELFIQAVDEMITLLFL